MKLVESIDNTWTILTYPYDMKVYAEARALRKEVERLESKGEEVVVLVREYTTETMPKEKLNKGYSRSTKPSTYGEICVRRFSDEQD